MVIEGNNKIEFSDIYVGEVWICSGQSNMERQLGLRRGQQPLENWEQEVASANYPLIRHFEVGKTPSDTPKTETTGQWTPCSPATAAQFTAIGYYFGRDLFKKLNVPMVSSIPLGAARSLSSGCGMICSLNRFPRNIASPILQ